MHVPRNDCRGDDEEAVRQGLIEERLSARDKAILAGHRGSGMDLATKVLQ